MNVVDLVKNSENYLGEYITVTGRLDRPRKKHSNYLFFNIDNKEGIGIQAVLKKDILGEEKFKKLSYGLSHGSNITVTGKFDLRTSKRLDFYKYEIIVEDIRKDI